MYIREIKIETTTYCPLKCRHCSVNSSANIKKEIPLLSALKIIYEFKNLGGKKIIFTGGEPLTYNFLKLLITFSKILGLEVSLYTTGLLNIDGNIAAANKKIQDIAKFVDKFLFCLHGSDYHTHDQVTQTRGSFNATVKAIKKLKEQNHLITIHHVPMKLNCGEITKICAFTKKLGISGIKLLRFVPQGRGFANRSSLEINERNIKELRDQIDFIRGTYPEIKLDIGTPFSCLEHNTKKCCGAGRTTLSINSALECSPCDGLRNLWNGYFRKPISEGGITEYLKLNERLYAVKKLMSNGTCFAQEITSERNQDKQIQLFYKKVMDSVEKNQQMDRNPYWVPKKGLAY